MKTRFTSLVKIKKDAMEKCERDFQRREQELYLANTALLEASDALNATTMPASGVITQLLQSRALLDAQRTVVTQQQHKVARARAALESARSALKLAMVEYEKFKFLEAEQIKELLQKQKRAAQRELDEIAVQNFGIRKGNNGVL